MDNSSQDVNEIRLIRDFLNIFCYLKHNYKSDTNNYTVNYINAYATH